MLELFYFLIVCNGNSISSPHMVRKTSFPLSWTWQAMKSDSVRRLNHIFWEGVHQTTSWWRYTGACLWMDGADAAGEHQHRWQHGWPWPSSHPSEMSPDYQWSDTSGRIRKWRIRTLRKHGRILLLPRLSRGPQSSSSRISGLNMLPFQSRCVQIARKNKRKRGESTGLVTMSLSHLEKILSREFNLLMINMIWKVYTSAGVQWKLWLFIPMSTRAVIQNKEALRR